MNPKKIQKAKNEETRVSSVKSGTKSVSSAKAEKRNSSSNSNSRRANAYQLKNTAEDRNTIILFSLIVMAVAFLLYAKALAFGYVYNDDNLFILEEPFKSFHHNLSNIGKAFTQGLTSGGSYYRPILSISWIIDAQFGGIEPGVYHFSNVLYHVIGSLLVFITLIKLHYNKITSLVFGLFFAVHPLLTPAACWISGRNDSLLAIFGLLSLISMISFLETSNNNKKWIYYILHVISFILTIYTKEAGAFFIFVGLVYMYINKKDNNILSKENISLIVCWIIISLIWYSMRHEALKYNPSPETIGMEALIANYPSFAAIIGKIFVPLYMVALSSYEALSIAVGLVFLGLVITLLFTSKTINKGRVIFGLLFFVFFIFPTLIVRLPGAADYYDYTEHRTYLPLFGIIIVIIEVLRSFKINFDLKNKLGLILMGIIVLVFGVRSFVYADTFDNRFSFWKNGMDIYPWKGRAYFDYAKAYMDIDSLDIAEKYYYKGIELSPNYKGNYVDLSVLYIKRKDFKKSAEMALKALSIDPDDPNASLNLGQAYMSQGMYDKAIKYFMKAEPANRNKPEMYISMGVAYFNMQDYDNAVRSYEYALRLNPRYALGYSNLAAVYFQMGQPDKAADLWKRTIQMDPNIEAPYHNLIIYYINVKHDRNSAIQVAQSLQKTGKGLPQQLQNMIQQGM